MDEVETRDAAAADADLAGLIECALLGPGLTEQQVAEGCERARAYGIAAVAVRPSDVELAARWMSGCPTRLATVVDVPFGHMTTAAKTFAVRDLLRRGAREIETVLNTGKLVSRQFQYLETELLQMADACHQAGALIKVDLESEYLDDELKIVACRIAKRAGADFIASACPADMPLLRAYAREKIGLKALGPVADLDSALALRAAGCLRLETANPAPILDAWKAAQAEAARIP